MGTPVIPANIYGSPQQGGNNQRNIPNNIYDYNQAQQPAAPVVAHKAVISLSGGLDSTMLLCRLLAGGYDEVRAYSFDYGQKHEIELNKVKRNVKFLQDRGFNLKHEVIDLKSVFSDSASSLHKTGGAIPQGYYTDKTMKSTVVENRNVIFSAIIFSKALSWANKTGEPVDITLGIHAGDHAIYPDCRPESMQMAAELFKLSNWNSERVNYIAPFINMSKGQLLREGYFAMVVGLKFSLEDCMDFLKNTHTCYSPDEEGRSCGKCGSCQERLEAFAMLGMEDPVEYVKEEEPKPVEVVENNEQKPEEGKEEQSEVQEEKQEEKPKNKRRITSRVVE